jgi:hypothetical protein
MLAPTIPVAELPTIPELYRDVSFKLRVEYSIQHSSVARELGREFQIPTLITWALAAFHPDGKKLADWRALRMENEQKSGKSELDRLNRIEAGQLIGVEEAKRVNAYRHEVMQRLGDASALSKTKHLGVTWQAVWLVLLETVIGKKTGWTDQEVMTAVAEFVTIALRASRTRLWFEEKRLRDILRSAIEHFKQHPSNRLLLLQIKAFETYIQSDPLLYLKRSAF